MFEPNASPVLNNSDLLILGRTTERMTVHIAMLASMPSDGSPIALRDLLHDMQQLTDPVHDHVVNQTGGYPNSPLRMVKRIWSCDSYMGRGWIDKDPVTGLWSYADGGLDQASHQYCTPRCVEVLNIMIKARDHRVDVDTPIKAVVEPIKVEVVEPIAAQDVKPATAEVVTATINDVVAKTTGLSVEDMIRQQIKDNEDHIVRLKQILKDHYQVDA